MNIDSLISSFIIIKSTWNLLQSTVELNYFCKMKNSNTNKIKDVQTKSTKNVSVNFVSNWEDFTELIFQKTWKSVNYEMSLFKSTCST